MEDPADFGETSMAESEVEFSPSSMAAAHRVLQEQATQMAALIDSLREQLRATSTTSSSARGETMPPPSAITSITRETPARPPMDPDVSRVMLKQLMPPSFNGTGQDSPIQFLRALESVLKVRALQFDGVYALMSSLLTGPAAAWFRSACVGIPTTEGLIAAFRSEYLSPLVETSILSQIQASKQYPSEGTVAFIDRLALLYAALPCDRPQQEIITQIIINALPQVALHLGANHTSLGELRAAARRVDSLLPRSAPQAPNNRDNKQRRGNRRDNGSSSGSRKAETRACYKCSEIGHLQRDCPNLPKNADAAAPHSRDGQPRF